MRGILIACTRMYAVCEEVASAWDRMVHAVSAISGLTLGIEAHPFPLDIEDLWARPDLGLTFICGRAFALAGMRHKPVAVPVRDGGLASRYDTRILVHRDSCIRSVADLAGKRVGWTVHHSHSGHLALKRHLQGRVSLDGMFGPDTGPLHTPANCLKALAEGSVDAAPLDGYCFDLLTRNAPERLKHVRILDRTVEYPMPFLTASPQVDDGTVDRLRSALFQAAADPELAPVLDTLCLTGFAVPDQTLYAVLTDPGEIPA